MRRRHAPSEPAGDLSAISPGSRAWSTRCRAPLSAICEADGIKIQQRRNSLSPSQAPGARSIFRAKAQRKLFRNAVALCGFILCGFASLRETFSQIEVLSEFVTPL